MKKIAIYRFILTMLAILALAACAKPLPLERSSYAGNWQSGAMSLLITQDGDVAYKRRIGSNTTNSVRGPLRSFDGNNFVVGVWPLKITFEVSVPPHEVYGRWKMTVDGVELTRE